MKFFKRNKKESKNTFEDYYLNHHWDLMEPGIYSLCCYPLGNEKPMCKDLKFMELRNKGTHALAVFWKLENDILVSTKLKLLSLVEIEKIYENQKK